MKAEEEKKYGQGQDLGPFPVPPGCPLVDLVTRTCSEFGCKYLKHSCTPTLIHSTLLPLHASVSLQPHPRTSHVGNLNPHLKNAREQMP